MAMLHAFQPTSIEVQAEITLRGRELDLRYLLNDPDHEVLDMGAPGEWNAFPRADELWKSTCFEAFWGKPGEPHYFELNLSPSIRQWNLYAFSEYRKPFPPARAYDFDLIWAESTARGVNARLKAKGEISRLEVSLTAIARTGGGPHYFALKHAGAKADFHLRESFVLGI